MIPADVHAAAMTATGRIKGGAMSQHQIECAEYVQRSRVMARVIASFPANETEKARARIARLEV